MAEKKAKSARLDAIGDETVVESPTISVKVPQPKMGRPTDYTEELASEICELISDGSSLKSITDRDDMPSRVSVHAWLIRYPEFLNKYEAAKALQADVYADEMDDIARDETLDVQRARLIIDTRKWTASKLKPKKYGDKVDVTSDGEKLGVTLDAVQAEQLIRARAARDTGNL